MSKTWNNRQNSNRGRIVNRCQIRKYMYGNCYIAECEKHIKSSRINLQHTVLSFQTHITGTQGYHFVFLRFLVLLKTFFSMSDIQNNPRNKA